MAERDIVNSVLVKLAEGALKDMLLSYGVNHVMEKVRRELSWIKFFIWDTDSIGDESRGIWESKVKDIGSQLDGWIGTFISEDKNIMVIQPKGQLCPGKMECMFRKPKKLLLSDGLRNQINQIQSTIQSISQGIKTIISDPNETIISDPNETIISDPNRSGMRIPPKVVPVPPQPIVGHDYDDNVIGLDQDKHKLLKMLLDENITRRSVISIVGQGGLGKTTLAQLVYNSVDVKVYFDIRMWLSVSQEFELNDLLGKLLSHIGSGFREQELREKDVEDCLKELKMRLTGKRYLIVLDDVWTDDLWINIAVALPDVKNGSRVLMTTRISDVAREADPSSVPYILPYLNHESSLQLLLRMAIRDTNYDLLNDDLLDIAKQFVIKCGGLPLALVVVAGLLSRRPVSIASWNKLLHTIDYNALGEAMSVTALSYDQLPFSLKPCFMYFALFPQDYEIEAKPLIRMWIAEGFIPAVENCTLENTAESLLEDLVSRSMVQVLQRSPDGSILACRIHDLMLDLAIERAKEDNFVAVCSSTNEPPLSIARRLAVHNGNIDEVMKRAKPNLRSLFWFNLPIPNCSKQRLLRVLKGVNSNDNAETYNERFKELLHLRYFELSGEISPKTRGYFGKLLGSVKNLQTLDLRRTTGQVDLPDSIWHVKTLRHVMLPEYTSGPSSSAELSNLQTLTGVQTRDTWRTKGLPNLPGVRDIDIQIVDGFPLDAFRSLLNRLHNLRSLKIVGSGIITVIDMEGFPFYRYLNSLSLIENGPLENEISLRVSMFPPHISALELINFQLPLDPIPILERLHILRALSLGPKACLSREMRCSVGGFPSLEELKFSGLEMLEWNIEEGAMPMIRRLRVEDCPRMHIPPGLQHLTTLQEVFWKIESNPTKAEEIKNLCKHVPSITVVG